MLIHTLQTNPILQVTLIKYVMQSSYNLGYSLTLYNTAKRIYFLLYFITLFGNATKRQVLCTIYMHLIRKD